MKTFAEALKVVTEQKFELGLENLTNATELPKEISVEFEGLIVSMVEHILDKVTNAPAAATNVPALLCASTHIAINLGVLIGMEMEKGEEVKV